MTPTTPAIEQHLAWDQHTWDDYPHRVWDGVPVTSVQLSDIIASVWQVQGFAQAQHRGKPAIRLDVENVVSGGHGRMVLTVDQILCDVKRYADEGESVNARDAIARQASEDAADPEAAAIRAGVKAWVAATGSLGHFDSFEQELFGLLCAVTETYTRLIAETSGSGAAGDGQVAMAHTLLAVAENVAPDVNVVVRAS